MIFRLVNIGGGMIVVPYVLVVLSLSVKISHSPFKLLLSAVFLIVDRNGNRAIGGLEMLNIVPNIICQDYCLVVHEWK